MTRRTTAWLVAILVSVICLPPAFFLGITLVGHARPLPYLGVWLDRIVLVAVILGIPALAGYAVFRLLARQRKRP